MRITRFDHRVLRLATAGSVVMGALWLTWEYRLRGGQGLVTIDWPVCLGLGMLGVFLGLAIRARATMKGELAVNTELTWVILLSTTLLPAAMLVVYAITIAVYAGFVAVSCGPWALLLGFAWAVQVAVWAGALWCVYPLVSAENKELQTGCTFVSTAYIGLTLALGVWIGGRATSAWDCTFPFWVWSLQDQFAIPPLFFLDGLRQALSGMEHGRFISLLLTIGLGLGLALLAALAVRLVRQQLMGNPKLRPYLPMAAAPLPDGVPMLSQAMLAPMVVYVFIGWSVLMALLVF